MSLLRRDPGLLSRELTSLGGGDGAHALRVRRGDLPGGSRLLRDALAFRPVIKSPSQLADVRWYGE